MRPLFALAIAFLAAACMGQEAEDTEWEDHKRADPKVVEYALASPDRAWAFITAPDSPYAERLAVAVQAGKVLRWSDLKRIEAAQKDVDAAVNAYAPEPHPESSQPRFSGDNVPRNAGRTVTILGDRFDVPEKRAAYPRNFEERRKMPWPWHVRRALQDARGSLFRSGDRAAFFAWAATLPCESAEDANFYQKVTVDLASTRREVMPRELVGAWRNLLLREELELERFLGEFMNTWTLRFDDPAMWHYAQVVLLDRVEDGDIYIAGFYLYQLRERINSHPGRDLPGPTPYVGALAIARRALADESIPLYERVMAGLGVARALGESFLPDGNRLAPSIDDHQPEIMRRFVEWFAPREKELAAAAAKQLPAVEAARAELAAIKTCAR